MTKCNMCVDRFGDGDLPACVNACPTSSIEIEAVNVNEWRQKIADADAPGVPPADLTLSTTRLTLPDDLPATTGEMEAQLLRPESPHWSLIVFLVLSQWSVGLFAALPFFVAESVTSLTIAASGFLIGMIALHAALFHLGRPVHALRAMKAWRHSWLSREVIAFSIYAALGVAPIAFIGAEGLDIKISGLVSSGAVVVLSSVLAVAAGLIGIACSVGIYRIPVRPAWDSVRTSTQFFGTAVHLGAGSALVASLVSANSFSLTWIAASVVTLAAVIQLITPWQMVLDGLLSRESPVRGAAILLTQHFRRLFWIRSGLLGLAPAPAGLPGGARPPGPERSASADLPRRRRRENPRIRTFAITGPRILSSS